jgi:hypothetical protein
VATEIEVNMRVPSLTLKTAEEPKKRIDNSQIRFLKRVTVPALPKPGAVLPLTLGDGRPFDFTVTRTDWNEEKGLFVASGNYANRSIPEEMYNALINDAEWTMKPLLQ